MATIAFAIPACGSVERPSQVVDAPPGDAPDVAEAPGDAPVDTPPVAPAFDIAYVSQVEIRNTAGVAAPQVALIINKNSTQSMDLSQLTVADVADDHPTAVFGFQIRNPAAYLLAPQQAGGLLTPGAATIVDPFVSEPRFNTQRPTFDFVLTSIPTGVDVTVNGSAKVRFGDQQAVVNIRFHVVATGSSGATFQAGTRVSSSVF